MSSSEFVRFIPTTYGGVLYVVDGRRRLFRFYVDRSWLSDFFEGKRSEEFVNALEERKILCPPERILHVIREKYDDALFCWERAKSRGWGLFSRYPLQVSFQVVAHCNAKCGFCFSSAPLVRREREIDVDMVMDVKDLAARWGTKLGFSGGEPTLHHAIWDLLSYREGEVHDTLITNLLSDFSIRDVVDAGVDLVQVSIHGFGDFHDGLVGIPGAFKKVWKRFSVLMRDVNVGVNTVVTEDNFLSIPNLVRALAKLTVEGEEIVYVRIVPALPSGSSFSNSPPAGGFLSRFKDMVEGFVHKYPELNFELPFIHANPLEYFRDEDRRWCPAGSTVAVVGLDGRLSPCNQFISTDIKSEWSLLDHSLGDLWLNDPVLDRMRRGFLESHDSPTACAYLHMKKEGRLSSFHPSTVFC